MYPLDLGGRGSCTIGGNISTNAGGNRVIRYGMTRDMVLGLEAVLADGTVLSSMNEMIKNNAGYDLKQLFIGSEGSLGIVTRAVLRLREKPRSQETLFVAVDEFDKLPELLKLMDARLGGALSAFEVLWNNFYRLVSTPPAKQRPPLSQDHPYYVLIEAMGGDAETDKAPRRGRPRGRLRGGPGHRRRDRPERGRSAWNSGRCVTTWSSATAFRRCSSMTSACRSRGWRPTSRT